ncbi:MAG: glycoside hydrolase family 97 protein [Chitinophagaceae bacterium]
MKLSQSFITGAFCIIVNSAYSQKNIKLSSPDGNIQYAFRLTDKAPSYSISFKDKRIIENSGLSLSFLETGEFKNNLRVLKPVFREAVENYELIVGKVKSVKHFFKEVIIPLEETKKPFRKINLAVRAFNDGLAFRYEFPEQKNWPSYSLTDENSHFNFLGDPKLLTLFLPNYTTSHEGEYSSLLLSEVKEDTLMDMPTLFECTGHVYVAITEAALVDYAGMYLSKHNGVLTSKLSPLPAQPGVKVKAKLPHRSPWRVMMISDRIGALIESNILTSLNAPNKIKDVSWIKPGKTTFPWWNGSIIPDTTFAPGNNFENNQYYIDFCARNGIEYHSVVESCGHEWYTNDGGGYQPGPNVDITKPVPGIDMQQICDYAKTKGVGIRVWVHWKALYPKLDTAFALFEKWGLKGMMVDFMDRDDQEMTNIKEEILVKAAKHKLHIQFHGAEKPTGLSRTYPNEFTREGTLNYEVNKWDKRVTPDHDLNIVFTRMLAGPADYHLGGFRAVPDSLFKVQYTRPLMLGTRCHMLAMYVVLENPQGMVCDYPAAYEGQPGFDFLKQVPTIWDETKVLDAKLREYIIVARRKDNAWYIGSINNSTAREISIPFHFLDEGEYLADIYTDSEDAGKNPDHLVKQSRAIKNTDEISLHMAAGGGLVMQLKRK